jgi:hypothetical protein
MLKALILVGGIAIALVVGLLVARSRKIPTMSPAEVRVQRDARDSLPPLDARGVGSVQEITRAELLQRLAKLRPLTAEETANVDRGCVGLTCLYQGLGQKRWPEEAARTVAYLRREDALQRRCPNGEESFVFVKQGWWVSGRAPKPAPDTGEVPMISLTRAMPGFYTFNYGVYFPSTGTYAWINHRDYGFPLNLIKPQKAYISMSPPPLEDSRPAQIYCSTCR